MGYSDGSIRSVRTTYFSVYGNYAPVFYWESCLPYDAHSIEGSVSRQVLELQRP